jgi:alpha-tubulin suppressor-like RCC1 family protein
LTNTGSAYCWGFGGGGDLGNGSTANSYVAIPVSGGMTFTTIAAGETHTCALTSAGDAYCWGTNNSGQLGTGTTGYSVVPVAVAGGLKFTALAATGDHTCGLVASGAAYCWGKNDFGQIGDGTWIATSLPGRTTPVPVSGDLTFSDIDAGGYHTCGVTSGGRSYCWGLNQSGQIGNGLQGTNVDALVPAVLGGVKFGDIFTGFYSSCGLTSDGSAYCWGSNLYGQLGNGSTSGPDYCPTYPNTGACSVRPIAVAGGLHFSVLALGGSSSCGLVAGGVAYCWGANTSGQLGNGSTTNSSVPVVVAGGLTFKAITAGIALYSCAITTADTVYCWGKNDVGQLGNGGTNSSAMPVAVSGWPAQ